MEAQINEIMRSLGRIEQKTDSSIASLSKIETSLEKHETRISKIEVDNANNAGKTTVIAAIAGTIVAFGISFLEFSIFKK